MPLSQINHFSNRNKLESRSALLVVGGISSYVLRSDRVGPAIQLPSISSGNLPIDLEAQHHTTHDDVDSILVGIATFLCVN